MNSPAKKSRTRFACLALVALTVGGFFLSPSTASAQFRRGFGGYGRGYGYGYRPGFVNQGFGYGYGGLGYGNGFYNRGYTGYSSGFYNRGYGGLGYGNGFYGSGFYGGVPVPLASPIAVPNYGYGAIGGYY